MTSDWKDCPYCGVAVDRQITVNYRGQAYCSVRCALEARDYWLEKKGDEQREENNE